MAYGSTLHFFKLLSRVLSSCKMAASPSIFLSWVASRTSPLPLRSFRSTIAFSCEGNICKLSYPLAERIDHTRLTFLLKFLIFFWVASASPSAIGGGTSANGVEGTEAAGVAAPLAFLPFLPFPPSLPLGLLAPGGAPGMFLDRGVLVPGT